MASFRCYDNSDVIAFLIMTNFHLYLIKLWWQFFQMFVYGDVVMLRIGRYWPWKTVTVSSHLHMPVRPLLLHRMALVSFRLYVSEKFGQLARIFWANGLPPPLAKNFPYAYARLRMNVSNQSDLGRSVWDILTTPNHVSPVFFFNCSSSHRAYQLVLTWDFCSFEARKPFLFL